MITNNWKTLARACDKYNRNVLLDEGAHPLEEHDCDGKMALHHAFQVENEIDAIRIVKLILNKCEEKEKSFLLYGFTVGIGSVEESLESNSMLHKFLIE